MFTLENTARATHATQRGLGCIEEIVFYDMSKTPVMYLYSVSDEWSESGCSADDIKNWAAIELSRPQSDIDALFNDAPDWATGYAEIKDRGYHYWVSDTHYTALSARAHKFRYNSQGPLVEGCLKSEFTIIATRPAKVVEDKPVYTQAMADAGDDPIAGMSLTVSFVNGEQYPDSTLTYLGDGVGCFKDSDGKECSFATCSVGFKPIDTRTDKQKAIAEILSYDHTQTFEGLLSDAYDKWVG